jgi:hypothetical protein
VIGSNHVDAMTTAIPELLAEVPGTNPPTDTETRINEAIRRGAPFERDGHGVRWWIGGCTW